MKTFLYKAFYGRICYGKNLQFTLSVAKLMILWPHIRDGSFWRAGNAWKCRQKTWFL